MYKPKTLCFGSSLKGNFFILPHLLWFVKNFFLIFLKNFFLDSATGSLADSLIILTYYFSFVNTLFQFFLHFVTFYYLLTHLITAYWNYCTKHIYLYIHYNNFLFNIRNYVSYSLLSLLWDYYLNKRIFSIYIQNILCYNTLKIIP